MSGYESDTCGRSYTIRIRYVWTQIFLYPHKKICGYKNLRIRVDGALNSFFGVKGAIYYVAIAKVIFSHVKITCYFHLWRYQVFARKLTWYFIGVYIINYNIFPVRNLPRYNEGLKAFHPLVNMECYLLRQFRKWCRLWVEGGERGEEGGGGELIPLFSSGRVNSST